MQPININSQRSARSEIHAVAGGRRGAQGGRSDTVHFSCCGSSNTSTLPSHRNSLTFWEVHLLACCQNCM